MHLNVSDIEIFTRDDNRLDRILKASTMIASFLLFVNAFFGYWISLNRSEFGGNGTNWGTFCFAVVVFYLAVKGAAFVGFLAVLYQWERILLAVSCSTGVLFLLGLLNSGLRANGFCFALLVLGALTYAILYVHLRSIEQCKARGHHYSCRGGCIRHEKVKYVDDKVLGGRGSLVTMFGTAPTSVNGLSPDNAVNAANNTHISFTNEAEPRSAAPATNDPWAPNTPESSVTPTTPAIISTQVEVNPINAETSELRRSTSQQQPQTQHRRQASQGQALSHLDASSLLQI